MEFQIIETNTFNDLEPKIKILIRWVRCQFIRRYSHVKCLLLTNQREGLSVAEPWFGRRGVAYCVIGSLSFHTWYTLGRSSNNIQEKQRMSKQ